MKNFDPERLARQTAEDDRTFQLGGEKFVIRPAIRPDALAGYDDISEGTTTADTLRILDELIVALIDPKGGNTNGKDNAQQRYLTLRARDDDPIELTDMLDLVNWCVEVYTARPTGKPSDSVTGRNETGTSSTESSSSPDTPTVLAV